MLSFVSYLAEMAKNTIGLRLLGANELGLAPTEEVEGDWELVPSKYPELTFGIEIEFALATLQPQARDPDPENKVYAYRWGKRGPRLQWNEKNVYQNIVNTLTNAGIQAIAEDFSEKESPLYQNSWKVGTDKTIRIKNNSTTYKWWAIEVISPVLVFNAQNLHLVEKVCDLLEANYRIETNNSTGLHVHVGNHDQGFDFETVQRLIGILWTFDPQISTIHSEYRRERSRHCSSLRNHSVLMQDLVTLRGKESRSRLSMRGLNGIFEVLQDTEHFIPFMKPEEKVKSPDERGAYFVGDVDLSQRVRLGGSGKAIINKPTVEFRQHGSTLEAVRVLHWISLCVRLVDVARNAETKALADFLRLHIRKSVEQFPIVAMLRAFDLFEDSEFYEKQIPIDEAKWEKEKARRRRAGEAVDDILLEII